MNFFISLYFDLRFDHVNTQNFHIGGINRMNTISLVVGASRVIIITLLAYVMIIIVIIMIDR